jgi:type VI secretion system protein ImpJ
MGQGLLPEHFYGQEQALREEVNLRLRMSPCPWWGLGTLQWDGFQLLKGILSIQEMTLILPSGTMIDVPGNTGPALLNLKTVGATRASIYVHLQGGFDVVRVDTGDSAEEGVERVVQKIELSSIPSSATGVQSFKLAEFECGLDAAWSLSPAYIPPSLQVGPSPFFSPALERMSAVVRMFQQLLMVEIEENHLAHESQATAKQCLHGVFTFQAMLVDLQNEIHHHPYDVYRALRTLYIDVCIFSGTQPTELGRPYAHEDIAGSFKGMLDEIERLLKVGRAEIPYVEFVRREGLYICDVEKKSIRRARDVFFLIQKPQVAVDIDVSRVKLASAARIHMVHERALGGIPFQAIKKPPFQHGLSSTVDFYSVTPGQEWDYAVRDGKVALFAAPQLEGTRLYLYWRLE